MNFKRKAEPEKINRKIIQINNKLRLNLADSKNITIERLAKIQAKDNSGSRMKWLDMGFYYHDIPSALNKILLLNCASGEASSIQELLEVINKTKCELIEAVSCRENKK